MIKINRGFAKNSFSVNLYTRFSNPLGFLVVENSKRKIFGLGVENVKTIMESSKNNKNSMFQSILKVFREKKILENQLKIRFLRWSYHYWTAEKMTFWWCASKKKDRTMKIWPLGFLCTLNRMVITDFLYLYWFCLEPQNLGGSYHYWTHCIRY